MSSQRCYACNQLVPDKELQEDIEGWKIYEALCRECTNTIKDPEDHYQNLNVFDGESQ